MKIILVTDLYPSNKNMSKQFITHALRDFVKFWIEDNDVIVVRPVYISIKNIKKWFLLWPGNMLVAEKIDDVNILNIHLFYSRFHMLKPAILFFQAIGFQVINKLLKNDNYMPDIVINHMLTSFNLSNKLKRRFNIPLIVGFHSSDIWIKITNTCLSSINAVSYRSYSTKVRIENKYIELKKKENFIANSGIAETEILPLSYFKSKRIVRQIRIITLSRLIPLKNIDTNLRVLSRISPLIDWEYSIVGEGPSKESLIELTNKLGIAHKISFYGHIPHADCLQLLKNNDIFIMVSAPETFGVAYLEAMAKGLIVIGAEGWGIDGIIKDGFNGYLCKPANEDDLYKKILTIINTDQQNVLLNSYSTIKKYTAEKVALDYLKFINKVYNDFHLLHVQERQAEPAG